jgi:hypothetical protein
VNGKNVITNPVLDYSQNAMGLSDDDGTKSGASGGTTRMYLTPQVPFRRRSSEYLSAEDFTGTVRFLFPQVSLPYELWELFLYSRYQQPNSYNCCNPFTMCCHQCSPSCSSPTAAERNLYSSSSAGHSTWRTPMCVSTRLFFFLSNRPSVFKSTSVAATER